MRKPTQADAELLLRLYELRRDPELRRARKWFLSEFKPAGWDEIAPGYLGHSDTDRWFRMTISYWEMVATLVNRDLLHAELFFDHTGEDIQIWDRCQTWIAGARAAMRPTYLDQLERLVKDHQEYRAHKNAEFLAAARGAAQQAEPAPKRATPRRVGAARARKAGPAAQRPAGRGAMQTGGRARGRRPR
jgi:hypothetical protein